MAISRISDRKQSLRTFSGVQNGSVYFDGSGDYITTPSTGAFQFEKDFTVECWVYPLSFSSSPTIWHTGTETTNRFITALNTAGQITTNLFGGSTTTYSGVIPTNQWTHLAWVRYGSTIKLFINGTASPTTETQAGTLGNGTFRIGADTSGAAGFLGYISNFRIVKDIAVYYGNFISPTAPFSLDTDSASVFFNGTSNYLNLSTTSETGFDWINGNTTIEAWVFPQSISGYKSIISKNTLDNTTNDWDLLLDSTGKLIWYYNNGSSTSVTSTSSLTLNTWSHVAFVYNKSSQQINLYINGANTAGAAYVATRALNTPSLKIGASSGGLPGASPAYFDGYMSQLRIVQNNLPILYSSNFTPPLTPLKSIPGTKLLTLQSSTVKDNGPNALRIENSGARATGLSATSEGYYSHYFDGTGDYLSLPSNPSLTIGTSSATVEFWIYPTAVDGYRRVISSTNGGFTSGSFCLRYNNSSTFALVAATDTIVASTIPPVNTWSHVAWVGVDGTSQTLYINGVIVGTAGSYNYTEAIQYIGGYYSVGPAEFVVGYISNARIVKGTALYNQPFSPPRLPFQPTQTLTDPRQKPEIAKSLFFDGTGDYVDVGGQGFAFGKGDFTIELWAYPTVAPSTSWNPILTLGTSAGGQEIRISQNLNGAGYGYLIPNNANNDNVYPGFGTLTLNQWHHLALVRNGSTVTLYRNGVRVGSTTGVSFNFTNTTLYRIGGSQPAYADGSFGGYISNLRIVKGQAVYTGNTFAVSSAPLELSQPASANIAAVYNYPILPSTGYSTYFDGTGDYLKAPNSAAFEFGSGNWTIECWINTTTTSGEKAFYGKRASTAVYTPILLAISNGSLYIIGSTTGSSWNINSGFSTGSIPVATGSWVHIAVVRNGTTITGYVNGVADLTFTSVTGALMTNTDEISIGASTTAGDNAWTGYISNFRIVKGKALYTSNFLPHLTPLTKIGSLNSGTNENVMGISTIPEKGYSAYFDGTGDFLTIPASSAFRHDQGDWTLECWLYLRDLSALRVLASMGTDGSVFNLQLYVSTAGSIRYQAGTGGWAVAAEYGSADGVIAVNNWYHVAYVRTGSTLSIYVNGAKVLHQASATFGSGASNKLHIGSNFENSTGENWIGYISNFRFVKDQAVYIGPFTPASAPFEITQSASSNVAALYSYTALPSTGRSVSFDGTGDYLTIPLNAAFQFGTGAFTVEAWIYVTSSAAAEKRILTHWTGSPDSYQFYLRSNNRLVWQIYNQNSPDSAALQISTNTWTHVAFSRSGSTIYTFINGVLVDTTTGSNSANGQASALAIGGDTDGNLSFPGYISNLRVVKGTAVYTREFTPDRAPLTAVANTSLLTCQSPTIIDNSTNNFTITALGDAAVSQLTPFVNTVTLLTLQGNTFVDSSANAFTMTPAGDTKIFKTFSPFGNTATLLTLQSNTIVDAGEDNIPLTILGDTLVSTATPFTNTTALLAAQSNAIVDNSNYKFNLTRSGDVVVKENSPFGSITEELINTIPTNGGSVYFDGTGDYLTLAGNAIPYISGAFNIDLWYYPVTASSNKVLFGTWDNNQQGWALWVTPPGTAFNGQYIFLYYGNYGSNEASKGTTSGPVPLNKWSHIAVSRDTSNNIRFFLDGQELPTSTYGSGLSWADNTNFASTPTKPLGIGGTSNYATTNGYISNFRFVNGQAVHTGNFTPPTAPTDIVQVAAANVAAVINTIPANGGGVYFDGTGDYLSIPANAAFGFGTGDFTIEYWVYSTSWASGPTVVELRPTSGNLEFSDNYTTGGAPGVYYNSAQQLTSSISIPINTWAHVAFTRSGTTMKIWVNGVEGATGTKSDNLQSTGTPKIGNNWPNANPFQGYISNLRIVKGTAVYTSAFTPPTAPLTAITNTSLLTCQSPPLLDRSTNQFPITTVGDATITASVSPFGESNTKLLTAQINTLSNSNLIIDNASGLAIIKQGNARDTLVESPFGYANTKLLTLQSLFPIDKSAANNTITLVGDARANVLANVSNPFRVHNVPLSNISLLTLNGNAIVDSGITNSGNPWALTVTGDTKTSTKSPFAYAADTSSSMTRSVRNKTFTRRAYEKNAKRNRQFMFANGGAFSTTTDGTYIYNVHVFLESNTLTVLSAPGAVKDDNRINFLVVAGGGGGASNAADPSSPYSKSGGGGGGGFVNGIHYVTSNVAYSIVVGGGGGITPASPGGTGGPSTISAPPVDTNFSTITAYGGGGGGTGPAGGGDGGSGGGGGGGSTTGSGFGTGNQPSFGSRFGAATAGPSATGGYGNPGGPWNPAVPKASPNGNMGSGGGGANSRGGNGPASAGGSGEPYQIGPPAAPHPFSKTYGGGGGGGGPPAGAGGAGGGAPGRNSPNPAPTNPAGGVNLGGGGGGGTAFTPNGPNGTAGGSGIVIAWYKAGYVFK